MYCVRFPFFLFRPSGQVCFSLRPVLGQNYKKFQYIIQQTTLNTFDLLYFSNPIMYMLNPIVLYVDIARLSTISCTMFRDSAEPCLTFPPQFQFALRFVILTLEKHSCRPTQSSHHALTPPTRVVKFRPSTTTPLLLLLST